MTGLGGDLNSLWITFKSFDPCESAAEEFSRHYSLFARGFSGSA
jgi:hypothetical protein